MYSRFKRQHLKTFVILSDTEPVFARSWASQHEYTTYSG